MLEDAVVDFVVEPSFEAGWRPPMEVVLVFGRAVLAHDLCVFRTPLREPVLVLVFGCVDRRGGCGEEEQGNDSTWCRCDFHVFRPALACYLVWGLMLKLPSTGEKSWCNL